MVGRASQPGNAPRDWERVLAQFESMPEELADLKRSLGDVLRRFDDALDLLGSEARRLSTEASTLALVADRLQTRLGDMDRAIGQERTRAREAAAQAQEPQFQPGEPGVTIILAAVPGFQGLMDGLRGLDGLGVTESASVLSFRNDEASIRVVLRRPASARQIVEGLQSAIRRQVLIEEARPEAQRLRLRFVEEESRR